MDRRLQNTDTTEFSRFSFVLGTELCSVAFVCMHVCMCGGGACVFEGITEVFVFSELILV